MTTAVVTSRSASQTRRCAQALAVTLPPAAFILLNGELGAGKSTFVKGIAAGLGMAEEPRSPTFALVREHPRLIHIDLYRLRGDEITSLGLEDYFDDGRIIAVEWADRAPTAFWPSSLPLIRVDLAITSKNGRRITLSCESPPPALERWIEREACGF